MAEPDPLNSLLTILSTNWNASNTNSLTPSFIKITDMKRLDFRENQDFIIAQRTKPEIQPAGVGPANKHQFDKFNLDIRVLGSDQEQHWLNVVGEIKRICDLKKVLPDSNYIVLDYDGVGNDLSDKTHWLWRLILPVQMNRYNIQR